jgi:hypothetical protein
MSETAYLFSQQHSLVLQEIASHLPTEILQILITAVKPSLHLKTVLLDVMYVRMKGKEKKYIFRFPAPGPHTPKPVICYTRPLPLDLHLLSDMNLCRIRWLIDLMIFRKQIPELKELMQYMENDSEDCEKTTLDMMKYYVFSKYDYCSDLETMRFDEVKRRAAAPHFCRKFYSI